jgi:hypothetical protein
MNPSWAEMLPVLISRQQDRVAEYLRRHAAHGDPILTKALSDFELNSVAEIISYGESLFWRAGSNEDIYKDYIVRATNLFAAIKRVASAFPEEAVGEKVDFHWKQLGDVLERHPCADPRAPFRPN